jgi:cytochrome b561
MFLYYQTMHGRLSLGQAAAGRWGVPAFLRGKPEMAQVSRYHPLLVGLHWALAVLIIAALALGALVMVKIPNADPMKLEALRSHMTGGVSILVLMLIRLFVRSRTIHPAPPAAGNPLLDRIAWVSHRALYAAVLGMAGSGLFMALQTGLPFVLFAGQGALPADFWAFPVRTVHFLISRVLMALVALHIAGALYHTLILRDGLLGRMLFGRRVIKNAPAYRSAPILEKVPWPLTSCRRKRAPSSSASLSMP